MTNQVESTAPSSKHGTKKKRPYVTVVVAVLVIASLAVGAWCVYSRSTTDSKQDLLLKAGLLGSGKQTLKIGVRDDLPGIALQQNGSFEGFDIDIAYAIANYLGFPRDKVELYPIKIQEREGMVVYKDGKLMQLDLVIAAYSITTAREKAGVKFSMPYFRTKQAAITRADQQGVVQSLGDLKGEGEGKGVCTIASSTAVDSLKKAGIDSMGRDSIGQCVEAVKDKKFFAVQSDAAILAGFAVKDIKHLKMHNIGVDFSEKWGVSIRPDREETPYVLQLVNAALYEISRKGEWKDMFDKHFGQTQASLGGSVVIANNEPPGIPVPTIRDYQ